MLATTFPLPLRIAFGHTIEEIKIVRAREGDNVFGDARFTIDALDETTMRYRRDGLMRSIRFARDGDGKIRAAMNGRVVAEITADAPPA